MNTLKNTGLSQSDWQAIFAVLMDTSCADGLILFGSRALGTFKQGSDVDLAIISSNKNCAHKISYLLNEEEIMPYKFDIVDVATIDSAALLDHINTCGIMVWNKNEVLQP